MSLVAKFLDFFLVLSLGNLPPILRKVFLEQACYDDMCPGEMAENSIAYANTHDSQTWFRAELLHIHFDITNKDLSAQWISLN